MQMTIEELKEIYFGLEDIPINDQEEIEEDYYIWEKGTDRQSIWDWFDEKCPNGFIKDFNLNF